MYVQVILFFFFSFFLFFSLLVCSCRQKKFRIIIIANASQPNSSTSHPRKPSVSVASRTSANSKPASRTREMQALLCNDWATPNPGCLPTNALVPRPRNLRNRARRRHLAVPHRYPDLALHFLIFEWFGSGRCQFSLLPPLPSPSSERRGVLAQTRRFSSWSFVCGPKGGRPRRWLTTSLLRPR